MALHGRNHWNITAQRQQVGLKIRKLRLASLQYLQPVSRTAACEVRIRSRQHHGLTIRTPRDFRQRTLQSPRQCIGERVFASHVPHRHQQHAVFEQLRCHFVHTQRHLPQRSRPRPRQPIRDRQQRTHRAPCAPDHMLLQLNNRNPRSLRNPLGHGLRLRRVGNHKVATRAATDHRQCTTLGYDAACAFHQHTTGIVQVRRCFATRQAQHPISIGLAANDRRQRRQPYLLPLYPHRRHRLGHNVLHPVAILREWIRRQRNAPALLRRKQLVRRRHNACQIEAAQLRQRSGVGTLPRQLLCRPHLTLIHPQVFVVQLRRHHAACHIALQPLPQTSRQVRRVSSHHHQAMMHVPAASQQRECHRTQIHLRRQIRLQSLRTLPELTRRPGRQHDQCGPIEAPRTHLLRSLLHHNMRIRPAKSERTDRRAPPLPCPLPSRSRQIEWARPQINRRIALAHMQRRRNLLMPHRQQDLD